MTKNIPGVLAALAVMLAGFWLADRIGHAILAAQGLSGSSPVSGVPVAIVLGLLLRNLLPLPAALSPGLKFATTTVLRAGIVLVGIRLSLFDVLELGLAGLPVVMAAIATGLVFVTWFNRKLGLPPRLGTLVAAGTSICGVTAIVSTAPAIEADEREVAYAVANVVAFGLFGMLVYPYLAHALLARSETIGLFLGTAVHDTSQVVGAALTYRQMYARRCGAAGGDGDQADAEHLSGGGHSAAHLDARSRRRRAQSGTRTSSGPTSPSWTRYVPGFVLGFLGMAVVRSVGDAMVGRSGAAYGVLDARGVGSRHRLRSATTLASRVLLGTAMAAVGLSTSVAVFKGVGLKPFAVGFAGALVVGAVGMLHGRPLRPLRHAVTACHGDWPRDTRIST